jgi:hypothetical protein
MPKLEFQDCYSNDLLCSSASDIRQKNPAAGVGTNGYGPGKRRRRPLQMNLRRRKLLRGVSSGLNVSEAGRAAGYGTAQSAHRAMNLIRSGMPEILEKCHFPAETAEKSDRKFRGNEDTAF